VQYLCHISAPIQGYEGATDWRHSIRGLIQQEAQRRSPTRDRLQSLRTHTERTRHQDRPQVHRNRLPRLRLNFEIIPLLAPTTQKDNRITKRTISRITRANQYTVQNRSVLWILERRAGRAPRRVARRTGKPQGGRRGAPTPSGRLSHGAARRTCDEQAGIVAGLCFAEGC
jgi:hypothetical protein